MEGFYSRKEAAALFGVSERMVQIYAQRGQLRVCYQGRRVFYPKEDVQRHYDRIALGVGVNHDEEVQQLRGEVEKLQQDVDVLKLSLGFGAPVPPRGAPELMLLRQKFIGLLTKASWTNKEISVMSDDIISIQKDELIALFDRFGDKSWLPLHQLADRMLAFVEAQPYFPDQGSGMLQARILRARERFLGLVYTTSRTPMHPTQKAKAILMRLEPPGAFDKLILDYVLAQ